MGPDVASDSPHASILTSSGVCVSLGQLPPTPSFDRVANLMHQSGVKAKVVQGCEPCPERFASHEEMPKVRRGIALQTRKDALFIHGEVIIGPFCGPDVHTTLQGVQAMVSGHAGGQDTVEHIDSTRNRVDDVGRVAHPHQISGLMLWQQWRGVSDDRVLHFGGLAD
jgi:hypothetical protein